MLDSFDYKEPSCALCGGKEFYNPDKDSPISTIPVLRIIEKLDRLFAKNYLAEAGRLLEFWQSEAFNLNDKRGELSICDELVGFYRKTNDEIKALNVIKRCFELIEILQLSDTVSVATIYLNIATTLKAFNRADDALPLYEKVYEIYSKNLDENDAKMAGFYNNKALALIDLKRFDEGFECYKKAIDIGLKLSDGKLNVAISYVNLAHAYEQAGRDKKQITECLFNAYELICNEDTKNAYYAFVLSKCAPSFNYFGFTKIAEEFSKETKEIYERT